MLMVRMGDGPIVPVFHTVSIDNMLNNNGVKNGHRLKNGTCERPLNHVVFLLAQLNHWMEGYYSLWTHGSYTGNKLVPSQVCLYACPCLFLSVCLFRLLNLWTAIEILCIVNGFVIYVSTCNKLIPFCIGARLCSVTFCIFCVLFKAFWDTINN